MTISGFTHGWLSHSSVGDVVRRASAAWSDAPGRGATLGAGMGELGSIFDDVPATDFGGFDEPGWGKIAANFSVLPYGASATLLTYECRTVTTDPDSRRRFLRYWRLIRPVVGHILRATLAQIAVNAEELAGAAAPPRAD